MKLDPLKKFTEWLDKEKKHGQNKMPTACCLSTIGLDGAPNARYMSIKGVTDKGIIITGVSSVKGEEMNKTPKVALTFWWPTNFRQVRIRGNVINLSEEDDNKIFDSCDERIKLISWASNQSKEINDPFKIEKSFKQYSKNFANKTIPKPKHWHAYLIEPEYFEFMELDPKAFQIRLVFSKCEQSWEKKYIQP